MQEREIPFNLLLRVPQRLKRKRRTRMRKRRLKRKKTLLLNQKGLEVAICEIAEEGIIPPNTTDVVLWEQ
jgi:hypothetical protein